MSILPHRNKTKMTNLSGTHTIHGKLLQILTFIGGTMGHVFCDCYDITLLTKGEGPHLLATRRQTMNSVWTNKVVFFQGHMCEYQVTLNCHIN